MPIPDTLLILFAISVTSWAGVSEALRDETIRTNAGKAASLETSSTIGNAKFQVIRLNVEALDIGGERYGMVRFKTPKARPVSLVWMFADVGNIEQYELIPLKPGDPVRGNRLIYPPLNEPEKLLEGEKKAELSLPKPWDQLELHLLGVSAAMLAPGEDYVIWFRFGDRQPADVLLAATFTETGTVDPAKLPEILGLPKPISE